MATMEIAIHNPTTYNLTSFNEVVLEYQDQVFNQAYRILGESKSAEDITQDTFLIAFHKFHTYRGGSMKAWLLRIATNLCYSELRREKIHKTVPLEPSNNNADEFDSPYWLKSPDKNPEEVLESNDREDVIQRCIYELPSHYRIVLVLIDIQGLDYAETASILGCPIGTVKSRLARSRIHLRYQLRKKLPDANM